MACIETYIRFVQKGDFPESSGRKIETGCVRRQKAISSSEVLKARLDRPASQNARRYDLERRVERDSRRPEGRPTST